MFRKAIVLLAMACTLCVRAAEDNVLLWWFNDPAIQELDGSSVHTADLVVRGGDYAGESANMVRIRAVDEDGNSVYLNMGPKSGVVREDWASGWMIPDDREVNRAGPGYADLSGLSLMGSDGSVAALTFIMELGYAEISDEGQLTDWVVMATGSDTLNNLRDKVVASELQYQGTFNWDGGTMVVPEPTSGMLVLIGGALLALRRRRKDLAA